MPPFHVHPRHLLDAETLTVVDLWFECEGRHGGFGGGHLPFAGGYADQPAGLMSRFAVCAEAWSLLAEAERDSGEVQR